MGLKKELPGLCDTQLDYTQPLAKELLYARILARNGLLIEPEAASRCRRSGGGSSETNRTTTCF